MNNLSFFNRVAGKPSYRSLASMDPLVVESTKRLASLFERAEMELRQLNYISSRAAIRSRNMDQPEMHAAIDRNIMEDSRERLESLFDGADLEIERLHRMKKIADRSAN